MRKDPDRKAAIEKFVNRIKNENSSKFEGLKGNKSTLNKPFQFNPPNKTKILLFDDQKFCVPSSQGSSGQHSPSHDIEIQNTLKPQGYIILSDQNPNDYIKIDDEEDDDIIYDEALIRGYYELQK